MSKKIVNDTCPVARSLSVFGDTWSILILRDAHAGFTRFDQFRKRLNIAPTMLTKRLNDLVEDGLLTKRRYSDNPPREEYILTQAGRDFLPILFVIADWGRKHIPHQNPDLMAQCYDEKQGTAIEPVVIDQQTGAAIGTRKILIKQGKSELSAEQMLAEKTKT